MPRFSEPNIATLASHAARIVELSLFMHKNCQYSGSLYFFINKRVLEDLVQQGVVGGTGDQKCLPEAFPFVNVS